MPLTVTSIRRPNLSREVQAELRRQIITGELPPGARLNEGEVAHRLSLSRTPVREALAQLVGEGLVVQRPRRGFFVTELSAEEVREIYPIRQLLDPEALRLAGVPDRAALRRLDELNERIRGESDAKAVVELDNEWHLALLARCPNRVLIELIRQFIDRTRRYELAYMSARPNVRTAVDEHAQILGLLEAGDLDSACAALRQNMTSAEEPILAWLSERKEDRV